MWTTFELFTNAYLLIDVERMYGPQFSDGLST